MLTIEIETGNDTKVTLFINPENISHIAEVKGNILLAANHELVLRNGMIYRVNERTFNKIKFALNE